MTMNNGNWMTDDDSDAWEIIVLTFFLLVLMFFPCRYHFFLDFCYSTSFFILPLHLTCNFSFFFSCLFPAILLYCDTMLLLFPSLEFFLIQVLRTLLTWYIEINIFEIHPFLMWVNLVGSSMFRLVLLWIKETVQCFYRIFFRVLIAWAFMYMAKVKKIVFLQLLVLPFLP